MSTETIGNHNSILNFVSCSTLLGRELRTCQNLIGRTWRQNCKVCLFHLKSRVEEKVSQILTFFISLLTNLLGPWSWQLCYFQEFAFFFYSFVKRVEAMGEEAPFNSFVSARVLMVVAFMPLHFKVLCLFLYSEMTPKSSQSDPKMNLKWY